MKDGMLLRSHLVQPVRRAYAQFDLAIAATIHDALLRFAGAKGV